MDCYKCDKKAVITLQHGSLCKNHFIHYFEDKVFKTINKFRLISRNDKICVATSGGKDSLTVLYLTKKYLQKYKIPENLFALVIDEGIDNYRKKTIEDLEEFCEKYQIELKKVSFVKEFSYTLDKAQAKLDKKPCNTCGVWRRYLLNKYARKEKATKVITGHNLDDEAQVIMMNHFKANTKIASHLGPISGVEKYEQFVQRVKPLYFCSEKETRLYTLLKKFQVQYTECPYAKEGFRSQVREMLNDFEQKYPGTKQGVVNSFLEILPLLKEKATKTDYKLKLCQKCGEPANKNICNTCKTVEVLQNG